MTKEDKRSDDDLDGCNGFSREEILVEEDFPRFFHGAANSRAVIGRKALLASVKGGEHIQELFEGLNGLANTLDQRIQKLIEETENDYFLAYKTHMYSIQEEFAALRKRADEQEASLRLDARIVALEKELKWFKNEAFRLEDIAKRHLKTADKLKSRLEEVDIERQCLKDQLKNARRSIKIFQSAVDRCCPNGTSPDRSAISTNSIVSPSSSSSYNLPPLPPRRPSSNIQQQRGESYSLRATATQHPPAVCVSEEELFNETAKLKVEVERQKKEIRLLKSNSTKLYGQKTDLEDLFNQCVEDTKREFAKQHSKNHSSKQETMASLFSTEDRRGILEAFFSSDDAQKVLASIVFKSQQEPPPVANLNVTGKLSSWRQPTH